MMGTGGKKKGGRSALAPLNATARFAVGKGRWIFVPVVALALSGLAFTFAWNRIRDQVLAQPQYQITYERVRLTPPPEWIRTPVKEPALRDASLDEPMSLLDQELPARIARALELHPWVAKVDRVLPRYPAEILVDVTYRRPVCMVELPAGFYPLDATGVLLPTGDFTAADPKHYPQLEGIESPPLGTVGSHWDDPRVVGGAAVAAVVVDQWKNWKLSAIVPSAIADGGHHRDEFTYRLLTKGGSEIQWGHAPGREISPEPDAAKKIAQLAARFAERGSLDARSGEPPLDLRSNVVPVTPRTAARESDRPKTP